jgi:hypothetical protein
MQSDAGLAGLTRVFAAEWDAAAGITLPLTGVCCDFN